MRLQFKAFPIALAAVAALAASSAAQAQVSVYGGGDANECSKAAMRGMASSNAIGMCTNAIRHDPLNQRDLAGTYVNRGVLYMYADDWSHARLDFNEALSIDNSMGEALVNRGATFIAEDKLKEGVADIDRGLQLNPEKPERAYYNRGMAKERLDDLSGAYLDYRKAAELDPNWGPPQVELKRFSVKPRQGS
jgi:tetratricopeptide (TPR) repeat protein